MQRQNRDVLFIDAVGGDLATRAENTSLSALL